MNLLSELPPAPPGRKGWPWDEAPDALANKMADGRPWPQISVVIPSYNQGQFIEETIRSVLLQGYPNLETIVFDGASHDNSVEIIKKYAPWLSFWKSEPDRGHAHALNKGLDRASGDLLAWLNSDDIYLPGALAVVAQEYRRSRDDYDVFVGDGQKVALDGTIVFAPRPQKLDFDHFLDWGENQFSQPACFFSKAAWQACRPIDETLYSPFDLDLWLRMARQFSFKKIDYLVAYTKAHGEAKTTNRASRLRGRVEAAILLLRYGATEYPEEELYAIASELAMAYEEIELLQKDKMIFRLDLFLRRLKRRLFSKRV